MKVKPSVKPICEKCKVIRRKGRVMAKCPIDPKLAELSDAGMIETYGGEFLEGAADACEKLLKK